MFGGEIRTLKAAGDAHTIGTAHGSAYPEMIRRYLDDRLSLAAQERWSGGVPSSDQIISVAETTLVHHERFSEELYVEMVAMAKAAGITPAEAVVVGGFTDLTDVVKSAFGRAPAEHNCSAILNPAKGFYAQTWDMHASAGEFVFMLDVDPSDRPHALVQTTMGCLGQMGMNEAGISVGINNLSTSGRPGVTWPLVVRKMLEQTDVEAAVEVVIEAELAGAHNYMVMGPDGAAVNIEAMPNQRKITRSANQPLVHTNHCLDQRTAEEEDDRLGVYVESSQNRLEISAASADDLDAFFADPAISRSVDDPHEVGSCGAVVIEPARRRMRAVWGVPGQFPWESFQL